MKRKISAISLLLLCIALKGYTQGIELIPYTSFQWGGKLNFYDGNIKFNSSENFGLAININTTAATALQLEYMRQATTMDAYYYSQLGNKSKSYDVNMDWYQLGFLKQIPVNNVVPFAGISLGALYFNPRTNEVEDQWKFSLTGQIGLKYFISEKIGIRLHLRMLMPVQWGGFNFYFGSGGTGTGVSAGSYIIQGDVGVGLIFRLGKQPAGNTPKAKSSDY